MNCPTCNADEDMSSILHSIAWCKFCGTQVIKDVLSGTTKIFVPRLIRHIRDAQKILDGRAS